MWCLYLILSFDKGSVKMFVCIKKIWVCACVCMCVFKIFFLLRFVFYSHYFLAGCIPENEMRCIVLYSNFYILLYQSINQQVAIYFSNLPSVEITHGDYESLSLILDQPHSQLCIVEYLTFEKY